jgi:iron complex outermembrane receptor protein
MCELKPLVRAVLLAIGGVALLPTLAAAQQSDAQKLERVEVTGTNIKRSDVETPAPVQIITREEIQRSGKQSIAEVIQAVSSNNQGSIPASFTSGFAAGSAGISLRGLGVNATLVLINGRRMAPYGLADDGQRTFVDVNAIPLEAVERIDVLKDGASAIYGSDAIGGVVNVILRKDFKGAIAGASYGQTKYNDGATTRAFGTFGFGDLASDRYNLNFTVEASKENRIRQQDRPGYLGTMDLRPWGLWDNRRGTGPTGGTLGGGGFFGDGTSFYNRSIPEGVVLDPVLGVANPIQVTNPTRAGCEVSALTGLCIFDQIAYADVQPQTERWNLAGRGTFALSAETQIYGELGLFNSKVKGGTTPTGTGGAVVFDPRSLTDPVHFSPLVVQNAILPATHPDNPFYLIRSRAVRILMTDLGGRRETIDNSVLRLIGGVTGDALGWSYDAAVGYLESKLKDDREGYLRFSAFQAALNDPVNPYRINNPSANSAALYEAISPKLSTEAKNSVTFVDAKISREMFKLPGGTGGVALGAEWRTEKTDSPPVPFTDVADIWGLGYAAFNSSRDVWAVFGETNLPVLRNLELSGAVRHDHYSDYGNSTTPKLGFKFRPINQLTLRGTYAESFRAPGPAENGNSSSAGYTGIMLISIGNPNVKPEEAKSYTLGLILEPWDGGSASIDYYRIKRTNEIIGADQAAILNGVSCPGGFTGVIPGAQPNSAIYCDTGRIQGASGLYQNANRTTTEGFDFDVRQRFNLGPAGRLAADLKWTYIRKFDRELADGTVFQYAGTHGPFVLSAAGGTPQNRGTLTLNLDRGPWAFTWTTNYVGRMEMIDHKGESMVDNGDGSFTTTTGESSSSGPVDGVCGVFGPNPVGVIGGTTFVTLPAKPYNNCKLPSFMWHDVSLRYSGFKNLELFGSILNVFNTMAPLDPYTYGADNYNPVFHQAGAVGRFYSVGFRYKFY